MGRPVATPQTIWDCRWSRDRRQFVEKRQQPESCWVCVRSPGRRRPVTEEACEECGFWEPETFVDPISRLSSEKEGRHG